jgi:hypothetical protein
MLTLGATGGGVCHLFGRVFDETGWVARHKDCIKNAKKD